MSRKQYNVGIVGYGLSAKIFHIPYIQSVPEFTLTAVCQRTVTPTNNAANDHPGVEVFENVEHLVKSSRVDLVVLCTPPADHFTQAKQCLEAGKHGVSLLIIVFFGCLLGIF
jgi:hypothetical protein